MLHRWWWQSGWNEREPWRNAVKELNESIDQSINDVGQADKQNPTEMGPLAPPLGGGGLELVEGG